MGGSHGRVTSGWQRASGRGGVLFCVRNIGNSTTKQEEGSRVRPPLIRSGFVPVRKHLSQKVLAVSSGLESEPK